MILRTCEGVAVKKANKKIQEIVDVVDSFFDQSRVIPYLLEIDNINMDPC